MKKYVLTGGPCSGKTTLLSELKKRGYNIVEESARDIIRKHNGILPEERQRRIAKSQLEIELSLPDNTYFLDRSIIDTIAYSLFHNVTPPCFPDFQLKARYNKIFLLERLSFKNDGERIEKSEEEAIKVHEKIVEAYQMFGYVLIPVPIMHVEQRADFILSKIND